VPCTGFVRVGGRASVLGMRHAIAFAGLSLLASSCAAAPTTPVSAPTGGESPSSASAPPPTSGTPGAASGPATPGAAEPSAAPTSTIAKVDAREDAHWIQADDYFVAPHAFEKGWQYVYVAKMKAPPAKSATGEKGEATFFLIHDGSEKHWASFYRTRPAVKSDLVLGNLVICFDNNKKDGEKLYAAPRDKDNARPGAWWIARITDLTDLEKGYATLAGHYHCAPDALRAIVE